MGFEYAQSLYKLERFDQAKAVLEPILAEHKQARGEADQATILVMRLLARVLRGAGDNTAAIDCLETNLAAVKQDPIANADAISALTKDIRKFSDSSLNQEAFLNE